MSYYDNPRPEVLPFLPVRRRVALEVGCGMGKFVSSLDGVEESWGIEPVPQVAEQATGRLTRLINGTFETARAELPKQHFDLVICNDVIEHMPDHNFFLTEIKQFIAPGGCLIGSIPNVRYYRNMFEMMLEKDWYYRESGILDATHMRFFTEKSLRHSFRMNGFRIDRMEGINALDDLSNFRGRTYAAMARVLVPLTLGYFRDIRFLQFGFRVMPEA